MDRLELLRRRQDEVEPLGDDVGDRLRAERGVEDVRGDLGVEVDAASPARRASAANRATRIGLASCATIGRSRASTSAPERRRPPRRPARDDAAVAPGDGERLRRAAPRPRVVEHDRGADGRLAREPRRRAPGTSRGIDDLDPAGVGDRRAERRRAGRRIATGVAGPPARAAVAPVAPRRRRAPACETVSKSSESWRPSPPSEPARIGRPEPQPAGRSVPTRAAATVPLVATSRSAWIFAAGSSPDIAGSRSISVRNSYSRKSRMTVSRS